jgi:membrane protease YdiL (CAAX protease family)
MIEGHVAPRDSGPAAGLFAVVRPWLAPAGIVLALGAVIGARWSATLAGLDALGVGLVFGVVLLGVGVVGWPAPRTLRRPTLGEVGLGVAGGAALIGIALLTRLAGPSPGVSFPPSAPFGPWAAITIVVAAAEELILRGALFSAVERAGGVVAAIALTSLAFALMHVPLYGWHVVPLDLGVGIFLGGLRLADGGWVGPAIAHAIADLATWWL